jgi:uncharacterized protein (DUF427 family)
MSTAPTDTTDTRGGVRVERGAKRIRAYLGGELVADTIRPLYVWERPYYPVYHFPAEDVRAELLEASGSEAHSASRGDARILTVRTKARKAPGAALRYEDSPIEELNDTIRLDWDSMDAWFEEDEEVFTHPRDPHTRVDILPSSRHVRVEVDGVTIGESVSPMLLFETGLPVRYYLPKTHVRMDLLTSTDTVPTAPIRGRPSIGRCAPATRSMKIWRGRIRPRCPRARRSSGWSPSTTRRSTSTSTACGRSKNEHAVSRPPHVNLAQAVAMSTRQPPRQPHETRWRKE